MNVGLLDLGCVRNTVDSQDLLASFARKGHCITSVENADVVVVNTCSFIEDAKRESIDAILGLVDLKRKGRIKKIVVAGCLSQRYGAELVPELKEVDAFIGVQKLRKDSRQAPAVLTPAYSSYLRISESCLHQCSFCIIPKLKGRFVSRRMSVVLKDAEAMALRGVREINVIGQDVTAYGLDLYKRRALADLLRRIVRRVPDVPWIRLLYAHPSHVTDDLLDAMAWEKRICRYLDIPLQHVSDRVLKMMGRGTTHIKTVALLEKVRRRVPGVALRTAFIVGFPGETEKDFRELLRFIEENPFDHVGVFTYSREEGTAAYRLKGQVPRAVRQERYERLMEAQAHVLQRLHRSRIGTETEVLIEERAEGRMDRYWGRSPFDAPDVDGGVFVESRRRLIPGMMVRARILGDEGYDLRGEVVDERA